VVEEEGPVKESLEIGRRVHPPGGIDQHQSVAPLKLLDVAPNVPGEAPEAFLVFVEKGTPFLGGEGRGKPFEAQVDPLEFVALFAGGLLDRFGNGQRKTLRNRMGRHHEDLAGRPGVGGRRGRDIVHKLVQGCVEFPNSGNLVDFVEQAHNGELSFRSSFVVVALKKFYLSSFFVLHTKRNQIAICIPIEQFLEYREGVIKRNYTMGVRSSCIPCL
jgi:hypothetical protein